MWIFEGWLGDRDRVPRLDDPEPFWQRHFWPPSAWGAMAIALVLSVLVGFVGALIYVGSEPTSNPVDPVEKAPIAKGDLAPGLQETTTTKPEILSPEALGKKVAPSVWAVDTLDDAGRPSSGSAFVAGSAPGQTFLLTSLAVVQSSTRLPSPDINVRNGNTQAKAVLWSWQEDIDLAMLIITRSVPSITWVGDDPPKPGDKLFLAAAGGGLSAGVLTSASPATIQHNIFTDEARRGGPLLTEKGQVLGMASQAYNPGGAGTDRVFFGVPIGSACAKVLACGSGNLDAGDESTTASSIAPPPGGTTTTTPGSGSTSTTRVGARSGTTAVRRATTTTTAR